MKLTGFDSSFSLKAQNITVLKALSFRCKVKLYEKLELKFLSYLLVIVFDLLNVS